jgi:hypothetical protein
MFFILTCDALQNVAPKLSEQFKLALKRKARTHIELVTRLKDSAC